MKLYVVMQGYYSDCHIERIFLEKKKAINFCKYHDRSYYDVYETNDDGYQMQENGYYRCYIECIITKIENGFETDINFAGHELISASECEAMYETDKGKSVKVSPGLLCGDRMYYVNITTFFRENEISEDKIDDVLKKIGYDTCAEVAVLFAEGRNLKQVKEIYNDESQD